MRLSLEQRVISIVGLFRDGETCFAQRTNPWTSKHGLRPLPQKHWVRSDLNGHPVVKIKSFMSQVFKHAQRHGLLPAAIGADGRPTNPVLLARCESGSSYEAIVVRPEQM